MDVVLKNGTSYKPWNTSVDQHSDCTKNATETNINLVCLCRNSSLKNFFECVIPDAEEWVLIAAYVLTFVVGVLGNILVFFVVSRNKEMRTVTNVFLVNLAVTDLTVILIIMPLALIVDVTDTWLFGGAMCKISIALGTMCLTVSILTLCAISLERWYAICGSPNFNINIQKAQIIIAAIWAISICVALPEFLAFTVVPYHTDSIFRTMCYPALWERKTMMIFQIFLMASLYFLPIVLIATVYTYMYVVLWRTRIPDTGNVHICPLNESRQPNTEFGNRLSRRRKTVKMLMMIVVVFALCFLPNHTLNILRYMEQLQKLPHLRSIALISHWCSFFNSCVNPIIYNFMSDNFRKEFRVVLSLYCHCGKTTTRETRILNQITCSETRQLPLMNRNTDGNFIV
ncbi:OX2R-like protein, partial [Mya arenaria]